MKVYHQLRLFSFKLNVVNQRSRELSSECLIIITNHFVTGIFTFKSRNTKQIYLALVSFITFLLPLIVTNCSYKESSLSVKFRPSWLIYKSSFFSFAWHSYSITPLKQKNTILLWRAVFATLSVIVTLIFDSTFKIIRCGVMSTRGDIHHGLFFIRQWVY
jgi:hypothetical protein